MTNHIPDGTTRLLLVEGPDDLQCFSRLLIHMQRAGDLPIKPSLFAIRAFGGKNRLREYMYGLLQHPNFNAVEKIGIVRDADYNDDESQRERGAPLRALDSVNTAIRNSYSESSRNLEPPELKDFISAYGIRPSYSLMIMPNTDNSTEGFLESTLLDALADDPMMRCVDEYFECVKKKRPESEVARNREDKQRLSVLLSGKLIMRDLARNKDATRELPRYMYNMKWWDDETFDHPTFDPAKAFLTQLLAD